MRKAIVTGGNGFLGSHLIQSLTAGKVDVHAIANTNHQRLDALLPADRIHVLGENVHNSAALVTQIEPDAIFHLAAVYEEPESIQRIAAMFEGNLLLGAALLYGASQYRGKTVFVNTGTYWQFAEDGSYSPNTVYAATKQAFQDLLLFYEKRGSVAATTLILYDTFGEGDTRSKLWTTLIKTPRGERVALSSGEQRIELVHKDDIVRAFIHAADLLLSGHSLQPAYSLRSGERTTLKQLIVAFNERAGLGLTLDWGARQPWEGLVTHPWQGPMLPAWQPRVGVLNELTSMARRHRQSAVAPAEVLR